jgi:hypothetical protein
VHSNDHYLQIVPVVTPPQVPPDDHPSSSDSNSQNSEDTDQNNTSNEGSNIENMTKPGANFHDDYGRESALDQEPPVASAGLPAHARVADTPLTPVWSPSPASPSAADASPSTPHAPGPGLLSCSRSERGGSPSPMQQQELQPSDGPSNDDSPADSSAVPPPNNQPANDDPATCMTDLLGSSTQPAHVVTLDAAPGVQTRLQKGIRQPKKYNDGIVRYALLTSAGEPTKLSEALSDPNWRSAMQDEYDALIANNTWHQAIKKCQPHQETC